jgi:hypothetical protein
MSAPQPQASSAGLQRVHDLARHLRSIGEGFPLLPIGEGSAGHLSLAGRDETIHIQSSNRSSTFEIDEPMTITIRSPVREWSFVIEDRAGSLEVAADGKVIAYYPYTESLTDEKSLRRIDEIASVLSRSINLLAGVLQ